MRKNEGRKCHNFLPHYSRFIFMKRGAARINSKWVKAKVALRMLRYGIV